MVDAVWPESATTILHQIGESTDGLSEEGLLRKLEERINIITNGREFTFSLIISILQYSTTKIPPEVQLSCAFLDGEDTIISCGDDPKNVLFVQKKGVREVLSESLSMHCQDQEGRWVMVFCGPSSKIFLKNVSSSSFAMPSCSVPILFLMTSRR